MTVRQLCSLPIVSVGAPGYTLCNINDWLDGQGLSADRLGPQTSRLEAKALGGDFALPIFD